LNNAVKHARARHVAVHLRQNAGALLLEIEDDGTGLAPQRAGLGLGVMRHRAKLVGGELHVVSKKGAGVKISCRLPLAP
jgi:signal transduction histidine kinase